MVAGQSLRNLSGNPETSPVTVRSKSTHPIQELPPMNTAGATASPRPSSRGNWQRFNKWTPTGGIGRWRLAGGREKNRKTKRWTCAEQSLLEELVGYASYSIVMPYAKMSLKLEDKKKDENHQQRLSTRTTKGKHLDPWKQRLQEIGFMHYPFHNMVYMESTE
ncbi:hypothetical protein E3N88_17924 [Mikania micrantha]|uniref:Uncharacterized protein n=1 Tax=Mikania micrantha TaxID=192012 RepID=A0A5N6NVY9_9ASTR|nr:hypothetical protein E3N88_17924 [Mikania micrantha]